jgi:hypothetical protein
MGLNARLTSEHKEFTMIAANKNDDKQSPVERALSTLQRIQSKALVPIALSFEKAINNISFLGITPKILVSVGYQEAAAFEFFQRLAKTDDIKGVSGFDDWFAQVSARVEEISKTEEAKKKFVQHLSETADRHLDSLSNDEYVGPALRSLRLSRLILTWTAFEILAGDAWETAVNESPCGLGQATFKSLPAGQDSEGVSARHISVGVLGRHGFDLRNKIGTVLRAKFDFTGVRGIREAYEAAFGKGPDLTRILADARLTVLESMRHLIVHRGGMVDAEFVRRTSSTAILGQPIPLENDEIEQMLNVAAGVGTDLLELVDKGLAASSQG